MEDLARTEGGWGRKEEEGVRAYLAPASRSCRPSEMRRRRGPPQQQAPVLVWSTERRGWIPVRAASIALLGADPAPSSPELVHPIHPSIHPSIIHGWVGGRLGFPWVDGRAQLTREVARRRGREGRRWEWGDGVAGGESRRRRDWRGGVCELVLGWSGGDWGFNFSSLFIFSFDKNSSFI